MGTEMIGIRTRALVIAVLVATVIWSSEATTSQGAETRPVDDPDAYAVYASLLPAEWSVKVAHAKTLLFQQETGTNWNCMPSGKPLETDWKPVVDNFRGENVSVRQLRNGFQLGIPYLVVQAADIRASFRDVPNDPMFGWTGFYRRFPDSGGIMLASAVGFDSVKRRAMVYLAHSCGTLCGGGEHHLLEKVDGVWREARIPGVSNCVWAS
jgi:hypothetical protein